AGNDAACLLRIRYNAGTRPPVAHLTAGRAAGATSLRVALSSEGTMDYDSDPLTYAWTITDAGGAVLAEMQEPEVSYQFEEPGIYTVQLAVTDAAGERATAVQQIVAGNEVAEVEIRLDGVNETFFFPGHPISYQVRVSDAEDG